MHYTATEQRIIDLLGDGLPHERDEVVERILPNVKEPQKHRNTVAVHIFFLRSKIRALGEDIITELRKGGIHYRRVVLLPGTKLCDDPI